MARTSWGSVLESPGQQPVDSPLLAAPWTLPLRGSWILIAAHSVNAVALHLERSLSLCQVGFIISMNSTHGFCPLKLKTCKCLPTAIMSALILFFSRKDISSSQSCMSCGAKERWRKGRPNNVLWLIIRTQGSGLSQGHSIQASQPLWLNSVPP